ncbi:putative Hit family protein 1 [Monocercomonoides exilis]|uniref:putative Hit family protein 1 n=1 Tax=Monocercomonoides exilis TaxID=2049356 RepID=UPI0035598AD5|nr:putative Hit family protein 1 [Monocercomonoides exilis]|eukprot:MONOS_2780.1-p1 / transcript=MONOS_2780.1 / gene=MONOS_2780 / organism=Monocercomonoides_exilis_PA203 / gene_product=HIT domain protein / transcript_product=HIT domain protein / location=Mono_scaffold00059:110487-111012(+) / protein_length=143 / sequence_SO=supercontig / SO=protein_coding / is_pseudo=false
MSDSCIFCKIASGEIPSNKVYETNKVIAFLDLNPASEGHVLVIPKCHGQKIKDIPDDYLSEVIVALKKISIGLEKMKGKELDFNILQNNGASSGQVVMHAHFHLIPKESDPSSKELGLKFTTSSLSPKEGELAALAQKIRDCI